MVEPDPLRRLRDGCARIASRSTHVRLQPERVSAYAAELAAQPPTREPEPPQSGSREALAAFWLTLDAVNFGSGWFPTLRKAPGATGYRTIEAGVRRRFARDGPWSAAQLQACSAAELAELLGQDPAHELMGLFAGSLNDLGRHIQEDHGGSFAALLGAAAGSAERLVEILAGWSCFADASRHPAHRMPIPFLKRAQIAAADLQRAGAARFDDLGRLTMFADNLVPHVLRLDGILTFSSELLARIEAEELLEHGSPEEVEIRACAVHAVELIVAAAPSPTTAAVVDGLLWHRGQGQSYKARPRHRCRCTAY